jgi:NADH-quinone oxidoreductase subunit J
MVEAVVFYTLAAFILGFAVLVITSPNTVHSVVFLVATFLCIAVLYLSLGAEFLAVIQVLVYAGGIVVLYLFVVMLVSLRGVAGRRDPRRQSRLGVALAAAVLAEVTAILVYSAAHPTAVPPPPPLGAVPAGNTEAVGWLLYTNYLVPFEVASMLLLAAMIGAIVLARRAE